MLTNFFSHRLIERRENVIGKHESFKQWKKQTNMYVISWCWLNVARMVWFGLNDVYVCISSESFSHWRIKSLDIFKQTYLILSRSLKETFGGSSVKTAHCWALSHDETRKCFAVKESYVKRMYFFKTVHSHVQFVYSQWTPQLTNRTRHWINSSENDTL